MDTSKHGATQGTKHGAKHEATATPYRKLLLMLVLSFASMYALMYAMVDSFSNVYASFNQLYMAGLMTAPMAILELALMSAMYQNKKLNLAIFAVCAIAGLGFWTLIRQQAAITDTQFLRSMIPHHAGAILMCEQAPLRDPAVKKLCGEIGTSQQSQIDFMKTKLAELGR